MLLVTQVAIPFKGAGITGEGGKGRRGKQSRVCWGFPVYLYPFHLTICRQDGLISSTEANLCYSYVDITRILLQSLLY